MQENRLDKSPLDYAIEAARVLHEALAAMKVTGPTSEAIFEVFIAHSECESYYKQAEKLFPGDRSPGGFIQPKKPR